VSGEPASRRYVKRCGPDLLRFAFWLSRDLTLAEDVVQETVHYDHGNVQ
jgi:DNA-directed RNA polymerase specialized sigma24 family protein